MGLAITTGNTVIFDSYTPEDEVRRRNIANNNVSKLNHIDRRFSSEFCVGVRASSITAILCASTVHNYRVTDNQKNQTLAAVDKRPGYMRESNDSQAKRQKTNSPPTTAADVLLSSIPKPISTESNLVISRQSSSLKPSVPAIAVVDPPDDTVIIPGLFSHTKQAGIPRTVIAPELAFHVNQNLRAPPGTMTFTATSSSPPLSPRDIEDEEDDDEEQEEDGPLPFPFKDHPMDPPAYNDPAPSHDRGTTSDNTRAVVSVGDVLQHPPDIDDIQHGASILQFLSSTSATTTKKQSTPPAKG